MRVNPEGTELVIVVNGNRVKDSAVDASGGSRRNRVLLSRFTRIIAATLLALFLGVHWFALQSVGWASMLVSRTQTAGWQEAVRTTFDGDHPCEVCKLVSAGRKAEKLPSVEFKVTKIEAGVPSDQVEIPEPPAFTGVAVAAIAVPSSVRSAPSLPPPRSC